MHVAWLFLVIAVVCFASAWYVRRQMPVTGIGYVVTGAGAAFLAFLAPRTASSIVALTLVFGGLILYGYGRIVKKERLIAPLQ